MAKDNNIEKQKKIIREKLGLPIEDLTPSKKFKDEKMVTVENKKEIVRSLNNIKVKIDNFLEYIKG